MPNTPDPRVRLLFDQSELHYDFGPGHPLRSVRLVALLELMEKSGLWTPHDERLCLPFRSATIEELRLVHTLEYIEAVQRLSTPLPQGASAEERKERAEFALNYGFSEGDTPAVPDMHEVAAHIAGGTLTALSAVMGLPEGGTFSEKNERPLHVFHPAAGWHHAEAGHASGFCIYNDIAVAIAHVIGASGAKIMYIDFDAHHGEGVQHAFYDDPSVMTVSFHETGRYLFPGSGDVLEVGRGAGRGYSVNIPLEPFTEDGSYIEAMKALLPPLALSFAPDVIISVHGCDTHAWDPLTHLALTLRGITEQIKLVHELTDTYCQRRWVAVGSGGYDLYRVVPRAWSILWAEMSGQSVPVDLPQEWVERWRPQWVAQAEEEEIAQEALGKTTARETFPTTFRDRPEDFPAQSRRWNINHTNRRTVAFVRQLVLPPPVRHAFPSETHHQSPLIGLVDLLRLQGEEELSQSNSLETAKGPLFLRSFCPPSFIERLRVESGMHAFAHLPEREYQLLLNIAKSPDSELTIAHTPAGEIVGEVSLAPGEGLWEGLENVYEVAIQVSTNWRNMGVAKGLLAFALKLDALEDMILFALGLSWHWDTEGLGVPLYRYRKLIAHLFGMQGFFEYATSEPDIIMEPGNIFMARIGSRVDSLAEQQFAKRSMSAPNLLRL